MLSLSCDAVDQLRFRRAPAVPSGGWTCCPLVSLPYSRLWYATNVVDADVRHAQRSVGGAGRVLVRRAAVQDRDRVEAHLRQVGRARRRRAWSASTARTPCRSGSRSPRTRPPSPRPACRTRRRCDAARSSPSGSPAIFARPACTPMPMTATSTTTSASDPSRYSVRARAAFCRASTCASYLRRPSRRAHPLGRRHFDVVVAGEELLDRQPGERPHHEEHRQHQQPDVAQDVQRVGGRARRSARRRRSSRTQLDARAPPPG